MDVNILKQELEMYCKTNGIKYKHIAEQINISESMLCHWRKDRKNIPQGQLEQLQKFIGAQVKKHIKMAYKSNMGLTSATKKENVYYGMERWNDNRGI